jgi:hypothetical protein
MMHTDLITNGDGQRTQVGPDPLDYVLRYTACDYDCYYQGRYISSRPTLPKAIEAVEYLDQAWQEVVRSFTIPTLRRSPSNDPRELCEQWIRHLETAIGPYENYRR